MKLRLFNYTLHVHRKFQIVVGAPNNEYKPLVAVHLSKYKNGKFSWQKRLFYI